MKVSLSIRRGKLFYGFGNIGSVSNLSQHLPPCSTCIGPSGSDLIIASQIWHESAVLCHEHIIFINIVNIPHWPIGRNTYSPCVGGIILSNVADKGFGRGYPLFTAIVKNTKAPDASLKLWSVSVSGKSHGKNFKIQIRVVNSLLNLYGTIPAEAHGTFFFTKKSNCIR